MQPRQAIGKKFHDGTKHSYQSVLMNPNYVDQSTQPSSFKFYPHFYRRIKLDINNPIHKFIWLTSTITCEKFYQKTAYKLRVNPSAGGLYPTEIYVQIRGIENIIDGIYHLEVANNSLSLIYELIDDGLENYIIPGKCITGFIFLISCVYYRSSWKYQNRSWRYCCLDSGHHLGAIAASAYIHNREIQLIFDFNKLALNSDLGFENKEFITACAISGEFQDKQIRSLRLKIPFVCGTNYFEANQFIEDAYKVTAVQPSCQQKLEFPLYQFAREEFLRVIENRRSIRRFHKQPISQVNYLHILQETTKPIPAENFEKIEIFCVIHRIDDMVPGLYKGMGLIKEGNFCDKVGYLCVNQAIARDSAVTLFLVSAYQNYQTAMQIAGFIGHRVYLISNYLGIGCSGIGAFYDDETQEFLGTDKDVLYAIVIGK
ncbi:MAG: nitroreductase family protein [Calothrix sp. MO_167.B42]|nr:nitroreductase family protein [Calothrix sp. MO_167.B42]